MICHRNSSTKNAGNSPVGRPFAPLVAYSQASPMNVHVSTEVRASVPRFVVYEVERVLRHAVYRLGARRRLSTLNLRFVGDREMTAIHGRFLGEEKPTDVLSFEGTALPGESNEPPLGDMVINWHAVLRQAEAATWDAWGREAANLAIHGFTHLLGHDHKTRTEARRMLRVERRVARGHGLGPIHRPYG